MSQLLSRTRDEFTCIDCKKTFDVTGTRNKTSARKRCTPCQTKHRKERQLELYHLKHPLKTSKKQCSVCKKDFIISKPNNQKTCSIKCRKIVRLRYLIKYFQKKLIKLRREIEIEQS